MLNTRRNRNFRIELSPERLALQASRGLVGWHLKFLADTRRILVCSGFRKTHRPECFWRWVGETHDKVSDLTSPLLAPQCQKTPCPNTYNRPTNSSSGFAISSRHHATRGYFLCQRQECQRSGRKKIIVKRQGASGASLLPSRPYT